MGKRFYNRSVHGVRTPRANAWPSSGEAVNTLPLYAETLPKDPPCRHVLVASVGRRLAGVLAGLDEASGPGWAGGGSDRLTCRLYLGGWIDVNQRVRPVDHLSRIMSSSASAEREP